MGPGNAAIRNVSLQICLQIEKLRRVISSKTDSNQKKYHERRALRFEPAGTGFARFGPKAVEQKKRRSAESQTDSQSCLDQNQTVSSVKAQKPDTRSVLGGLREFSDAATLQPEPEICEVILIRRYRDLPRSNKLSRIAEKAEEFSSQGLNSVYFARNQSILSVFEEDLEDTIRINNLFPSVDRAKTANCRGTCCQRQERCTLRRLDSKKTWISP